MKTRFQHLLERRFGEWSAGKKRSVLIAAALFGLVVTTESADAQCYGGTAITIVSGNNQTGAPNAPLPQPLVVSCDSTVVSWAIVSGSGTLGATTTSPPNHSNTL